MALVSFQRGMPGPEGAEGDGAAHQSHLQILAKQIVDSGVAL